MTIRVKGSATKCEVCLCNHQYIDIFLSGFIETSRLSNEVTKMCFVPDDVTAIWFMVLVFI